MSAEAEDAAKSAPPAEGAAKEAAAPAAGGGMSPMVFFGAMGLSWVLMLGGGFALVQFVLPAKLAEAMKTPAAAEATEEKGHGDAKAEGKKEEGKKAEKGHGDAKAEGKKEEGKKEEKGHGDAKAEGKKEEGKKEEKGHGEAKGEGKKEEGANAEEAAKTKEFILSEIVVNVAGSRGARYVKASVFFDAAPEVIDELERQRARIIDLVSSTISSKTMDDLTGPNARGNLREELMVTCNGLLKKGQIKNLYFVDFLIQ